MILVHGSVPGVMGHASMPRAAVAMRIHAADRMPATSPASNASTCKTPPALGMREKLGKSAMIPA
jgi:hypothetical protein